MSASYQNGITKLVLVVKLSYGIMIKYYVCTKYHY